MDCLENRVLGRLAVAVFTSTVDLVFLGSSILCSYLWRTWSSGLIICQLYIIKISESAVGQGEDLVCAKKSQFFCEVMREAGAF